MPQFSVEITETLQDVITVKAEDEEEALSIVEDSWKKGDYILGSENFMGADFRVVQ